MGMVYQFRPGKGFGVDPQVAGEALEALGDGNLGSVRPQAIVDAARPAGRPLHPVFEWDDRTAAEAHRRQQARALVGAIVAVMPERPTQQPLRAFVSVRQSEEPAYVPIRVAMSDADLRAQVLAEAMRELVSWRHRHRELEELAGVFAQIDWLEEQRRADEERRGK